MSFQNHNVIHGVILYYDITITMTHILLYVMILNMSNLCMTL